MTRWVIGGVAAAGLAWLALTGVVYLVVFVSRRRREHAWLAAQSLLIAVYPLWVLEPGLADAHLGWVGGALALGGAASVELTHAHFGLASPGRAWPALATLGVSAGLLARIGVLDDEVMASVTLLVIAAAVAHQIEVLVRLCRAAAPKLNARLFLGAWVAVGVALLIDGIDWLATGRPPGARAHLSASLVAVTALAFLYTVALARQHGLSLEEAERQRRELQQRLDTIETKSREIDALHGELRRQLALRSRQLARALLARGSQPGHLARGREIGGRYQIVDVLGSGGMGVVYEVTRASDGRRFALKLLHGRAAIAGAARFAREAEILAQLHHPNLVAIVDVDVSDDGQLFLVMELVAGVALDVAAAGARARDRDRGIGAAPAGALDRPWCLRVLTEVASGLVAIHAAGIVHRDLKPANILIAADERGAPFAKIADFGVASFGPDRRSEATDRAQVSPLTATGVIMGTPRYMAPELAGGAREAAFPVDVFAFGVMAYELLCGEPPHHGFGGLRRQTPPPPLGLRAPDLSPELVALVHDCLAWEPERRPDAPGLLERLRALPAPPPPRALAPSPCTSPTVPLAPSGRPN